MDCTVWRDCGCLRGWGERHDSRPKAGGILCGMQDEAMLTVGGEKQLGPVRPSRSSRPRELDGVCRGRQVSSMSQNVP